jgi:hypothetical protein
MKTIGRMSRFSKTRFRDSPERRCEGLLDINVDHAGRCLNVE